MAPMKYYIFLMIGIFLSLGMGILIGVALQNRDVLENQQILLAQQIEDRFIVLRSEADLLKDQLDLAEGQRREMEALASLLTEEMVRDKLSGMSVAVLTWEHDERLSELLGFLQRTGAKVRVCTMLGFPAEPDWEGLGSPVLSGAGTSSLAELLIRELIHWAAQGESTEVLMELVELGLLDILEDMDNPADAVLLYMGSTDAAGQQSLDTAFIEQALPAGLTVIGVGAGEGAWAGVSRWMSVGISTVDHADTYYGKLALVALLAGGHGNYGIIGGGGPLPEPLFYDLEGTERQPEEGT